MNALKFLDLGGATLPGHRHRNGWPAGPPLIHRAAVRRFILDTIERTRPGFTCTRVSADALDMIDARLRAMIRKFVHEHPTRGKTFAEIL